MSADKHSWLSIPALRRDLFLSIAERDQS